MAMTELEKFVNDFIHDCHTPLCQSLKAHIELSYKDTYHISPSVLKGILKKMGELELNLRALLDKEGEIK